MNKLARILIEEGLIKTASVPRRLYHATFGKNESSIRRQGLRAAKPGETLWYDEAAGWVHGAESIGDAAFFMESYWTESGEMDPVHFVVFEIDTGPNVESWEPDPYDQGAWRGGDVAPENLRKVKSFTFDPME